MKKILAVVLTLSLVLAFAGSAMADRNRFDIVTTSTTSFQTGCSVEKKTDNHWFVRLDEEMSNLSSTHRAVCRVHQGSTAISPTWVYSGPNETDRSYNTGYQGEQRNISFRGRLDNRDSGTLEFHGYFHHSYGF